MRHDIPIETLGPQGETMAHAVAACVHCGFCLPVCPTYQVMGEEMDSPRGRIILMKEMLEGNLRVDEAVPFVDRCLGCQACMPACPSGVPYGELLMSFRSFAGERRQRDLGERLARFVVHATLPYPGRFRLAATLGRLARPLRRLAPAAFRPMLDLLPARLPAVAATMPEVIPAQGKRRARVALLIGCVQQVLAPQIHAATLRVLARNGVEVVVPSGQGCCGALAMHGGEQNRARALARANLRAFPPDVDAVITNAAGCGSGMKEYPLLFKGLPEEQTALALAAHTQDVTVFLDELGLLPPPPMPEPLRLAYHDACHLAHAQGVRLPPRRLLAAIPNLTVVEIPEGDLCCGSAGTYNLEQPETAFTLGQRKAHNIIASGAAALATGNVGCLIQIQAHLAALGHPLPLYHTVEVLDRAYNI